MNAIDEKTLHRILSCFSFDTEPVSCEPYGCGHINLTYLVVSAEGRRYILQRMNEHVTVEPSSYSCAACLRVKRM